MTVLSAEERQNLAKAIIENPLFPALLTEMEASSVNSVIAAKDHDARQAEAANIRAIRNFRQRLEIAAGNQSRDGIAAPA